MTDAFATRLDRDVVTVRGADATSFLQSLLSQDVDGLAVGSSALSLLLQPQGKLVSEFRLTRVAADAWSADLEPGAGEALAAGLNRFKIRVQVEVETSPAAMVAVRGPAAPPADVPDGARVLPLLRGTWTGYDIVGAPEAVASAAATTGVAPAGLDVFEVARIEAGVPRLGTDLDERTIPQEAFLDEDAVSFTKGCFVGQELVCRIDTRGHVNRHLRRLRADRALVTGDVAAGDATAGRVTSVAGTIGLAMLRREVEPGATVVVDPDGAAVAAVVEAVR